MTDADPNTSDSTSGGKDVDWQSGGTVPFADAAELLRVFYPIVHLRLQDALLERSSLGLLPAHADPLQAVRHSQKASQKSHALSRHQLDLLRERLLATARQNDPVPLALALKRWQLSPVETLVLLSAILVETSPQLSRLVQRASGTATLNVEMAAAILGLDDHDTIAMDAVLSVGTSLVDMDLLVPEPGRPFLERPLILNPRVIELARGVLAVDTRSLGLEHVVPAHRHHALALDAAPASVYPALRHLLAEQQSPNAPVPVIVTRPGMGAVAVAARAAELEGWGLLAVPEDRMHEISEHRAALLREARLASAVVCMPISGHRIVHEPEARLIASLLVASVRVVLVAYEPVGSAAFSLPLVEVDLPLPDALARRDLWRQALGPAAQQVALDQVADGFEVGPDTIARAVRAAVAVASGEQPLDTTAIKRAMHAQIGSER